MQDVTFVNANELETLEQYGASLLSGMVSIQTLQQFHIEAYKRGLLDTDEEETSKTICWEFQRLLALYQTQLTKIIERTGFNEKKAIDHFKSIMPEIKIKRKRKSKEQ